MVWTEVVGPLIHILALALCTFVPPNKGEYGITVFVVEVLAVPQGNWTNGKPPTVEVDIVESIVGQTKLGRAKHDWTQFCPILCGVGEDENLKQWSNTKIDLPAAKTRWIVHQTSNGPGLVTRLPDSPANRRAVLESVKQQIAFFEENQLKAEKAAADLLRMRTTWDLSITDEKLRLAAKQADFIAMGIPSTASNSRQAFTITKILKGQSISGSNHQSPEITTELDNEAFTQGLWNREDQLILFLKERPIVDVASSRIYETVGDGLVLSSDKRLNLLAEILKDTRQEVDNYLCFCGQWVHNRKLAQLMPERRSIVTGVGFMSEQLVRQYPTAQWFIEVIEHPGPDRTEVKIYRRGSTASPMANQLWDGDVPSCLQKMSRFIHEQTKSSAR